MDAGDLDPSVDYIFTIGHSNTPLDVLLGNLRAYGIEAVVDVRTQPVSRFAPQFNRRSLEATLPPISVEYAWAGDALGGRPDGASMYDDEGYVRYDALSESRPFRDGMTELLDRAHRQRVVIMCSEEEPAKCHRHLLLARVLREDGVNPANIVHIRRDGTAQTDDALPAQAALIANWRSPVPITHRGGRAAARSRASRRA